MRYCAIKDNDSYFGYTKEDIVNQICIWGISLEDRKLTLKVNGFPEETLHSYNDNWSKKEMYEDAARFVLFRLKQYGYQIFELHPL